MAFLDPSDTGPLRSVRKTPINQMSGPLYATGNSFQNSLLMAGNRKYEQHWDNDYGRKNEHLLMSRQLEMCNDPYCTTCPTYIKVSQQRKPRASIIFDPESIGRGKKVKSYETEEEKAKEVVHVRARRGQATDSHSLAERTMGMAVMLDEIINYVQSLQHQVEFLSLKPTAAGTYYDFNSEADGLETVKYWIQLWMVRLGDNST